MQHYVIGWSYSIQVFHDTPDLVEATRFATAVSLHTGKNTQVGRCACDDANHKEKKALFTVNPSNHDFRQVTMDAALHMKAMAHDLVSNIEAVVPEIEKESWK